MIVDRVRPLSDAPESPGLRLRNRCQSYCRGVIIAAGVAFQQIGPDRITSLREHPPYVQLLEESPEVFSEREVVGRWVLTTGLQVPARDDRMTGNQN